MKAKYSVEILEDGKWVRVASAIRDLGPANFLCQFYNAERRILEGKKVYLTWAARVF